MIMPYHIYYTTSHTWYDIIYMIIISCHNILHHITERGARAFRQIINHSEMANILDRTTLLVKNVGPTVTQKHKTQLHSGSIEIYLWYIPPHCCPHCSSLTKWVTSGNLYCKPLSSSPLLLSFPYVSDKKWDSKNITFHHYRRADTENTQKR